MNHTPLSLQLLFAEMPALDSLGALLRAYHPDFAAVTVDLQSGRIAWGRHVVKLLAFDTPMPAHAIEACLQAALLPPEVKADARRHAAHVILHYAGEEAKPLEQMVAVAAVAGVLAELGAMVTLHEEARAAILSTDLLPDQVGEDMMAVLRALPLPYLYAGFVKMLLSDISGVWMRTFAAHRFGVPDLAYHAASHDEGQATFARFSGLHGYLLETGLLFEDGEVIRIDDDHHYRVRLPKDSEWWLESPETVWVLEASA